jgi:hypothetical protein
LAVLDLEVQVLQEVDSAKVELSKVVVSKEDLVVSKEDLVVQEWYRENNLLVDLVVQSKEE